MICGIPVNTNSDISKLSQITYNNLEISLVVFMPNIATNHAITYTNSNGLFGDSKVTYRTKRRIYHPKHSFWLAVVLAFWNPTRMLLFKDKPHLNQWLYPTKCSCEVIKKISNKFHREALDIIMFCFGDFCRATIKTRPNFMFIFVIRNKRRQKLNDSFWNSIGTWRRVLASSKDSS